MKNMILNLALLFSILTGLLLTGCEKRHREPNVELIQDMMVSPAIKAQDEDPNSMKTPPEGSVPQGFEVYPYASAEEAGAKLKSPLTINEITIQAGQIGRAHV